MIITLKVGAAAPVTFCHGTDRGVDKHCGPNPDVANSATALAQIDPVIGATFQTISDRQNLIGTYRFGVSVQKASVEEASYFASTYPQTAPRFGTLRIASDTNPTTVYVEFPSAHVGNIDARQNGVTVELTYSVTLGAQTAVHP